MEDLIVRFADNLIGRTDGPLVFRLLVQPAVSVFLAIRAGLADARHGRPPYLWAIVTDPGHRRDLLRDGWKDVGKVFVLALILDVVYQVIVFRWVYPGEMLTLAVVLAVLPYLLLRGLVTRLARRKPALAPPSRKPAVRP